MKDSGTREIELDLVSKCDNCVEGVYGQFGHLGGYHKGNRFSPFATITCEKCKGDYKFKELELEVSV